jgi:hypothetical protein
MYPTETVPPKMPRKELEIYPILHGIQNLISIDVWGSGGGLPASMILNCFVLKAVDHFNSYLNAFPIKNEKASILIFQSLAKSPIFKTQDLQKKISSQTIAFDLEPNG